MTIPFTLILGALLPSLVLVAFICFKDRVSPEPTKYLIKAFIFGMISADASLLISTPLSMLGVFPETPVTVFDHFRVAFFGAGVPEELAKFFMLWLALRHNPAFDENFDGIVYAVCVGMGFAFVENIGYLASAGEYWVHLGIVRSIISVPGHYVFAVFMGYYYSLVHFNYGDTKLYKVLMLAVPILAHTMFDWILMVSNAVQYQITSSILTVAFLLLFFNLQKLGRKDLMSHLSKDYYSNITGNDNDVDVQG